MSVKFEALVRTNISEECSASILRVTRIGELGTSLAITSNRRTLPNIPENGILQYERLFVTTTQIISEHSRQFLCIKGIS
jgi:hypothetical protein